MNLQNIVNWQLSQLDISLKTYITLLHTYDEAALTTYRDGGTGWTATEVIGHLRDYETLFLERVRLTVTQDNPPLPNPNPDELAVQRQYNARSWRAWLNEWQEERARFIAYLKEQPLENWERTAQHPTRGTLTLLDLLCLANWHGANHLEQVTRILAEQLPAQ